MYPQTTKSMHQFEDMHPSTSAEEHAAAWETRPAQTHVRKCTSRRNRLATVLPFSFTFLQSRFQDWKEAVRGPQPSPPLPTHSYLVAKERVECAQPPPRVGVVNHVVVKQAGHVDQLGNFCGQPGSIQQSEACKMLSSYCLFMFFLKEGHLDALCTICWKQQQRRRQQKKK
jgi:hypothetical protein